MKQVDLSQQFAFGHITSLSQGLGYLITPAFSIAAVAVVFYFLIGAIKYITSGGEKEPLSSAQAMITHAIIGFILLILIFIIAKFIPEYFGMGGLEIVK